MKENGEREGTPRLDQMVEEAGVHLASKYTRRSFLGRMAAAAGGIMWGGAIVLGEKSPSEATTLPTNCFGTVDVNVCYSTWRVVNPEYTSECWGGGVVLRKGPSFSAPPLYRGDGTYCTLAVGEYFGRMSNRDGGVDNGCPSPGPRNNVNGFLWGYKYGNSQMIGWIPYSVGGTTYSVGDGDSTEFYSCGPAYPDGADFDCRDSALSPAGRRVHCPNMHNCGGNEVPTVTCSTRYRPVVNLNDNYSNCSPRFLLRYAPDSTAFFWVVPGDILKEYCRTSNYDPPNEWVCVMAYCTAWAPYACRGWIRGDALGPYSSYSSCDLNNIPCPSGSSA